MSEGTPTGQPPRNGGSYGREEQLATVRTGAATRPDTFPPRIAPSGPPLQPRVSPNQTPPSRPQPLAEQPDGLSAVPVQPDGGSSVEAMPPPPETRYPPDQRLRPAKSSRPPAVPVWDPPAPPRPKRSIREWLGFGHKPEPHHAVQATKTSAAVSARNPVDAPAVPRPTVAAPDATTVDPPVARTEVPGQRDDGAKQAEPAVRLEPAERTDPRIEPAERTDPRIQPAPGQARQTPPPGTRAGALPAVGAATAAVASAAVAAARSGAEKLAAQPKPKPGQARRTRKARLRLSRMDPWSVMKTSFLFSIAAGIMLVVAVYTVWAVLESSGLFESINDIVASVVSTPGDTTPFRVQDYVNTQKVMGVAALIACVDVVIFTALATLGSFLYNLAATMLGGLEITLAED